MISTSTIAIILAFVIYLGFMVFIGYLTGKQTNDSADYFLGGRQLPAPVAALSAQASDMSGWLLMGLPGSIYALGTGQAWIGVGLLAGTIINWVVVARPLRAYTIVANNSLTMPEFLTNRFHDEKSILKGISAVVITVFFTVYTASAFAAGGKLFNSILGLDYHISMLIGAGVILVYTLMGGFRAVCDTDFVQGMMMLAALLVVPIVAYAFVAGDFTSLLESTGVTASRFLNPMYDGNEPIQAVTIISNIAWGLGYFGMPHIIIRFFAIRTEKEVKKSATIAIVWDIIATGMTIFLAIVARAFLAPTILGTAGAPDTESVFIEMIKKVFIDYLPLAFLAGLFLCGILAAIMSTADSQLLMCSSSISQDIYKGFINKEASDARVLSHGRIVTIVVTVIAVVIAWNPDSSIMDLVSDAWAGLGAAFGPLILLSLFWKRTNLQGALAGMISGAAVVVIWDYLPLINGRTIGSYTGLYSLIVGFVVGIIAIIVVSLATREPDEAVYREFEAYKNYKEN